MEKFKNPMIDHDFPLQMAMIEGYAVYPIFQAHPHSDKLLLKWYPPFISQPCIHSRLTSLTNDRNHAFYMLYVCT